MFAIIRTGGKQYRVAKNDIIKVEKLDGEAGAKVVFDEVLMMGDDSGIKVGTPYLADTRVDAEILTQDRDNKIIVFKKKRRKNYRRKQGHRQDITVLRITGVEAAKPRRKAQGAAAKTKADDQPKGDDKPADTAAEKVKAEESN